MFLDETFFWDLLEDLVVTVWIVPSVTNSHGLLFVILVTLKTIMYYFEIKFFES